MRILCVSDIHSNLAATLKIKEFIKEISPDKVICLGDVVGYGASPNEVCSIIRELSDVTLLGNHDAAVAGFFDFSYYYPAAREALLWTQDVLDDEHRNWLGSLPYTFKLNNLLFSHGDPVYPERYGYIYLDAQVLPLIKRFKQMPKVVFIGHSHLTKVFAYNHNSVSEISSKAFTLEDDKKYVVTVGSIGQPRDGDNRSCCLLFDTEEESYRYFRLSYDIDDTASKILNNGLYSEFAYRLYYGR